MIMTEASGLGWKFKGEDEEGDQVDIFNIEKYVHIRVKIPK